MQSNNNNLDLQEQARLQQDLLRANQERFLGLCYNVFNVNKEGKELLGMLRESLIEKSPCADPDKGEKHAFYREGQNSLIRMLYHNITAYELVMKANAKKTERSK